MVKDEIKRELSPLLGKPLTFMFRAAGIQAFEFGQQRPAVNRKGEAVSKGDWRINARCDWSIRGPAGVIVSSADFGPGRERRDDSAAWFYEGLSRAEWRAVSLGACDDGQLAIELSGGFHVEFWFDPNNGDPNGEQWRFFREVREGTHPVVGLAGLERV